MLGPLLQQLQQGILEVAPAEHPRPMTESRPKSRTEAGSEARSESWAKPAHHVPEQWASHRTGTESWPESAAESPTVSGTAAPRAMPTPMPVSVPRTAPPRPPCALVVLSQPAPHVLGARSARRREGHVAQRPSIASMSSKHRTLSFTSPRSPRLSVARRDLMWVSNEH